MNLSNFLNPAPDEFKQAGIAPARMTPIAGPIDYPGTLEIIAKADAQAGPEREQLVAQRDEHLLLLVRGDKTAAKEADKLETKLAEHDRLAEWRRRAAAICEQHIAAEAAARAKAETAARWEQCSAKAAECEESARRVHTKGADLVDELKRFAALRTEMYYLAPTPDKLVLDESVLKPEKAFALGSLELRRLGATWMMSHLSSDDMLRVPALVEKVRAEHAAFLKARGDQ